MSSVEADFLAACAEHDWSRAVRMIRRALDRRSSFSHEDLRAPDGHRPRRDGGRPDARTADRPDRRGGRPAPRRLGARRAAGHERPGRAGNSRGPRADDGRGRDARHDLRRAGGRPLRRPRDRPGFPAPGPRQLPSPASPPPPTCRPTGISRLGRRRCTPATWSRLSSTSSTPGRSATSTSPATSRRRSAPFLALLAALSGDAVAVRAWQAEVDSLRAARPLADRVGHDGASGTDRATAGGVRPVGPRGRRGAHRAAAPPARVRRDLADHARGDHPSPGERRSRRTRPAPDRRNRGAPPVGAGHRDHAQRLRHARPGRRRPGAREERHVGSPADPRGTRAQLPGPEVAVRRPPRVAHRRPADRAPTRCARRAPVDRRAGAAARAGASVRRSVSTSPTARSQRGLAGRRCHCPRPCGGRHRSFHPHSTTGSASPTPTCPGPTAALADATTVAVRLHPCRSPGAVRPAPARGLPEIAERAPHQPQHPQDAPARSLRQARRLLARRGARTRRSPRPARRLMSPGNDEGPPP